MPQIPWPRAYPVNRLFGNRRITEWSLYGLYPNLDDDKSVWYNFIITIIIIDNIILISFFTFIYINVNDKIVNTPPVQGRPLENSQEGRGKILINQSIYK